MPQTVVPFLKLLLCSPPRQLAWLLIDSIFHFVANLEHALRLATTIVVGFQLVFLFCNLFSSHPNCTVLPSDSYQSTNLILSCFQKASMACHGLQKLPILVRYSSCPGYKLNHISSLFPPQCTPSYLWYQCAFWLVWLESCGVYQYTGAQTPFELREPELSGIPKASWGMTRPVLLG